MARVNMELEIESKRVRECIIKGVYTLIDNQTKGCTGKHWSTIKCVVGDDGEKIKDTYACSLGNCFKVFQTCLKTCGTGKLTRHYKQCNRSSDFGIDSFFDKEFTPPSAKKIRTVHKTSVSDAAVSFVVNDLRPVDAVTKTGILTLLAAFTQIGAVYGKMEPEDILNVLPSRFTVSSDLTSIMY